MNMIRLDKAIRLKPSTFVNVRRLAAGHGHGHADKGHGDHGHADHGHGHDDHGHGGHHEPFEVPHYSKYNNWDIAPELAAHQQRLHVIGLHDPWIRNHAWMYHPEFRKHWGRPKLWFTLFGGLKYGLTVAVVGILLTEGWIHYHKDSDHHIHDEHH